MTVSYIFMVFLRLLAIAIGILMFIISGLAFSDEKYLQAVAIFILATIICTVSIMWAINDSPNTRTVKCSEIKQVDTIYKNDSIIGYELILEK